MTAKSWLRDRAEKAANSRGNPTCKVCGATEDFGPCNIHLADAVEQAAREFAQRTLRTAMKRWNMDANPKMSGILLAELNREIAACIVAAERDE